MRRLRMTPAAGLLMGQLAAFWPAWRWYGLRLADRSDQSLGIIALATFVVYVAAARRRQAPVCASNRLWIPSLLLAIYIVSRPWMPPMIQAALAIASVGCAVQVWLGRRMHAAAWGLLILSLPLLPSLEFYFGYPLRLLTGLLAKGLLGLSGFIVTLDGAALSWNGRLIAIDAPCSGLKMLWAGVYLALALGCLTGQPPRRLASILILGVGVVIVGNAMRAAALFFPEAGLVHLPPGGHEAEGIVIFAALAGIGGWLVLRERRPAPCRP